MTTNSITTLLLNDKVITCADTATKAVNDLMESMSAMHDHLEAVTKERELSPAEKSAGERMVARLEAFSEMMEELF